MSIHNELTLFKALRERLLTIYGDDLDEQTLLDTLEGETDLIEALKALYRDVREDEGRVNEAKTVKSEIDARKKRLEDRIDRKKNILAETMSEAGLKKIEAGDFTLSLRNGTAKVVVTDESQLPEIYKVIKEVVSPDKAAIKAAIEANETVPGAHLSNPGITLTARKS
jgi:hypothetical protein